MRHLFSKHGGNLGATGAVAWQFERRGLVLVAAEGADEEGLLLVAADAGADDVSLDGSTFEVSSAPSPCPGPEALEAAGFHAESAELAMVPKTTVAIADESTARRCCDSSRARGGGRRPGRVRELRHPRGGAETVAS